MAASVVGGAFLSAFVNVLFDRLSSPGVAKLIQGKKLDQKLIQRLETTLYAVQAVLNDAEQKQIKDPAVKKWLDDLKDAVYIADDLLDKVSTEAATQKEVSNLFSRYLNLQDRKIANEVEDITGRLEHIVSYKDKIGLKENVGGSLSWRTPSTSWVEESNIYGRVQDKEAIVKMLIDDNCEGKLSVIPIVGMGGVGKTTLAQWIFGDENLTTMFDFKAWVCVSEEFDIVKVTKTIIEAITPGTCNTEDLNLLQLDLKRKLTGKKFFIVLDDIWNNDYDHWNNLKKPFQYGMKGSKILITTREEKVASTVQTCPPYHISQLSDEHCWSVFANHACFPESNGNSTLEKIGREIVKKCKGLPLAAQTLGGLLRARHDAKDWNNILTSDIWEFPDNESKIIPALRVSYYHLPPHLKRCFTYCSLYPKDYEISKDELILLWMAEDLLARPMNGKTLEEVGSECFDELSSRLFFKKLETSNNLFVMHDLMHDLAISVAGEFYFGSEELGKADKMSIKTRHLSYRSLSHPISKNRDATGRVKFLRTFLPMNSSVRFSIEGFACDILRIFKFLRVLSFEGFRQLDVLPHSIGALIHLRYLNLSRTSIKILPEPLCNLYNLQTLKLYGCFKLILLPSGMQNLVNLRHLDIRKTGLKEMPNGMSKLKDLLYLSGFVVGKHKENNIKELGELSNIHGPIHIWKLENVTNSSEAFEARLMDKSCIKYLQLEWSSDGDIPDTQTERDILDKFHPHKELGGLHIEGYRGTRFPDWVGHSSYHSMTRVSLRSCKMCFTLPSLGQLPSRKYLEMAYFDVLETIGVEFYKSDNDNDHSYSAAPFPSLEHLMFLEMACWQAWHPFEFGAFPKLKILQIHDCPRLRGSLPNHLLALETLEIVRCEQLVSSVPRAPAIRELFMSKSDGVGFQELPLSLESLEIGGCQVESMFQATTISPPPCLQHLTISDCSSAISFPGGCLLESLVSLAITRCRKLEFPKEQQPKHESLKSSEIRDSCDSLTSFPLDKFPNLILLEIGSCENLESLTVLQDAALQRLLFKDCPKLKSLPCHMNTFLPNLEHLSVWDCPEIESFPDGGLPPNLKILDIQNCEKLLSSLSSIGVHEGITTLYIDGPCESVKSFPMEGLLPLLPSLTTLSLDGFSCLETLDCKGLRHLASLEHLGIRSCPKLKSIAGERLPASLLLLIIYGSPLLEERCQKKDVDIWPKISHIRGIKAQERWIS